MMIWVSIFYLVEVSHITLHTTAIFHQSLSDNALFYFFSHFEQILTLCEFIDFYDPDGYYFNAEGKDEFGGYYDDRGYYHPGPGNKHEFEEYEDEDEEDELIKQFERGHAEDEDVDDE